MEEMAETTHTRPLPSTFLLGCQQAVSARGSGVGFNL